MEAFLIYCLLEESPPLETKEHEEATRNHTATAKKGREPLFELVRNGQPVSLVDWATQILGNVREVAELIDKGEEHGVYAPAVDAQLQLVFDSELTPSARLLTELKDGPASFFEFAMACTAGHKQYFADLAILSAERQQEFANEAAESLRRQADIEAADTISLEKYLERWFGTV